MGSFSNWDTLETSKFGKLDFSNFNNQNYFLKNHVGDSFWTGSNFNKNEINKNNGLFREISFRANGTPYVFIPEKYINKGVVAEDKTFLPYKVLQGNNLQEFVRNSEYVDLSNSAIGNEAASKGIDTKGYLFPANAVSSDNKLITEFFADPGYQELASGNVTGLSKIGDRYVYSTDRLNGYVDESGTAHWTNPKDEGLFGGDFGKILAVALMFVPGGQIAIAESLGVALGLSGTAATVVGSAILQGTLAEAQGGDFLDGAIKGAVTAGIAPVVANTVGQSVANVMADSAVKDVITNAVSSSASSAVTAALTGGDVGQAALTGALAGAGGAVGRELGIASEYGTTPFSEQTQALASQEVGLGGAGSIGSSLGQAAGAIAGGVDPAQALLSSLSRIEAESRAATPTSGSETTAEAPVSPPPGAEITTAPPPETDQITDTGVMDGVAGTIPEITPPSTQEIPIPDQISQELGGIQEGIATTIPEGLAPPDEIPELAPPDMGVQEGIVETIPEDLGLQGGIVETIPEDLGEDPLLGLSDAEVGLGEQEAIDRQALEDLSSAEVGLGEQEAIDAIPPQTETTPYIRDTYISGGRRKQPTFGPTVTTLGQALAAPLFPSAPVSGLTSYRGAGEIEGQKTGKPRKNVWNEASLRLKDALGL